jgi:hypothetical protein
VDDRPRLKFIDCSRLSGLPRAGVRMLALVALAFSLGRVEMLASLVVARRERSPGPAGSLT